MMGWGAHERRHEMAKGVAGQGVEDDMRATTEQDKVEVNIDIQVFVHEDEVTSGDVVEG